MKKYCISVILIVFTLVLSACHSGIRDNNAAFMSQKEKVPYFSIENAEISTDEEEAVILVRLMHDPGFLAMAVHIEYDATAMTLTDVKNGTDYQDYHFVAPKNKKSGCTASWFLPELPGKIVDGYLLELHFAMTDKVKCGSYPINISPADDSGMIGENHEVISVDSTVGYLTVK